MNEQEKMTRIATALREAYKVVEEGSEAQGYMKYINDASTLVVPIAHPVMTDNTDRQLFLKSWF